MGSTAAGGANACRLGGVVAAAGDSLRRASSPSRDVSFLKKNEREEEVSRALAQRCDSHDHASALMRDAYLR